ncbi:hypothetical protein ACFQ3B_04190 [Stackebrandtia endophytica]|uniref:hypothetical protein n=1 Tax=Stackebrandtia endophytica TaxID=1496996 RepID=UPI00115100D4|nr:hypothetical protein [Stackebrandtia endophytica]
MSTVATIVVALIERAVQVGQVDPDRAAGMLETAQSSNTRLAFDFLISHLDDTDAVLTPSYFADVVLAAYKLGVFTEPDPDDREADLDTNRILRATIDRLDESVDYAVADAPRWPDTA